MIFQPIINKLALNPKRLFLIDCLGAILSAFSLGVLLVKFESIIGMPQDALYVLASIAGVFAVYSFFCYFRISENWRPFLKAIAIANFIYCCLTIALMIVFRQELTHLGFLYFILEIIVILSLVNIELKTAAATVKSNV